VYDNKKIDNNYKRNIGYVIQNDILLETMTVRECLQFSTELKIPELVSSEEKNKRIELVLEKLNIQSIKNNRIGGFFSRGISGGERRRV
jgi:ATP-binding cassette, subfamily G (WHITE), member 2